MAHGMLPTTETSPGGSRYSNMEVLSLKYGTYNGSSGPYTTTVCDSESQLVNGGSSQKHKSPSMLLREPCRGPISEAVLVRAPFLGSYDTGSKYISKE